MDRQENFCGTWGKLREDFIKKNNPSLYQSLKDSGELFPYLEDYQNAYSNRAEILIKNLEDKFGIDENFFKRDSLGWILAATKIFLEVNSTLNSEIQS